MIILILFSCIEIRNCLRSEITSLNDVTEIIRLYDECHHRQMETETIVLYIVSDSSAPAIAGEMQRIIDFIDEWSCCALIDEERMRKGSEGSEGIAESRNSALLINSEDRRGIAER